MVLAPISTSSVLPAPSGLVPPELPEPQAATLAARRIVPARHVRRRPLPIGAPQSSGCAGEASSGPDGVATVCHFLPSGGYLCRWLPRRTPAAPARSPSTTS